MRRILVFFVGLAVGVTALLPGTASAQVTTSTVAGVVRTPDGEPVAGAQVSVLNTRTGFQTGALTNDDGRFTVPFLEPGGPYTIRVTSLGYGDQVIEGAYLALGQTSRYEFTLSEQALELDEIVVTYDPRFGQSRTGQQTVVTDEQLLELPTLSRNFTELASLSPLVSSVGGASIAGQNNRFNNIQIDGAVNNDVFGLASSGVPGGQANGKPISQDAIAEFQVLVAPFDVRQAGFTGGLINAVTKTGTNDFAGTGYAFWRNESLERGDFTANDDNFTASEPFTNAVIGGTLGGPIIRDKLHFFVSGEFELRDNPLSAGIESAAEDLGISPGSVTDVQSIAEGTYNLPFGRTSAYTLENPALNLFGRLDWQINNDHRASFKYTRATADDDEGAARGGDRFEAESNTYDFSNETNSFVGQLFSSFGKWQNEALVNFQTIRDRRAPEDRFRFSQVTVEVPSDPFNDGAEVRFGIEQFSHANELDQDVFQFTNNLSATFGDHRWTFGVNAERWQFRNLFFDAALGVWDFDSTADFAAGDASRYQLRVAPGLPDGAVPGQAEFAYWNLGAYVQDEISIGENLTLTPGLRVDMPVTSDEPLDNTRFASDFGISTTSVPSGNPMIQPRLGFNYRVGGDPLNQVRGGAGVFAGRPPFVWMSNAFGNTGVGNALLRCFGDNTPTFDARDAPTRCADGSGAGAAASPVALVDPDFVFPTDFRINVAWDREWEGGWRTTIEGIFTKAVNAVAVEELNGNRNPGTNIDVNSIGDRVVYGTPVDDGSEAYSPNLVSNNFLDVIRLTNTSEPYSYQIVGEVEKLFTTSYGDYSILASYAYGRSYDLQAFTSSRAISNYGFSPLGAEAGLDNLELRPSNFDRPHRVNLVATGRFFDGLTTLSAIYRGQSGAPYSYIYRGDINGDGFGGFTFDRERTNDLVFIPENSSDLTWDDPEDQAFFDALLEEEECLQDARGTIMKRNACRRPWVGIIDLRLSQKLPSVRGNQLELILDVFNFANLLNEDWGTALTGGFATERLLDVRGRVDDDPNGEIIFDYEGQLDRDSGATVAERPLEVSSALTRYRINLGVRWIF